MTKALRKNPVNTRPSQKVTKKTPPPSVGAFIRDARVSQKKEIESLSKKLKISSNYLIAIEEENRKELPSMAYTLGFIRSIATYLNLDPNNLCKTYKEHIFSDHHHEEPEEMRPIAPQKRPTINYVFWGIGLTILIGGIGFYFSEINPSALTHLRATFLA